MIPLPLAIGGLVLLAVALFSGKAKAAGLLTRIGKRGPALVAFTEKKVPWKRLRNGTVVMRTEIAESPSEIGERVSQALGRTVAANAVLLATLMASEAGDKTGRDHPLAKVAIAHAAMTEAKARRRTLAAQLIPDGKFGSQQGRYAATRLPPTKADVELAEAILLGKVGNPTPGATNWDSPRGQRAAIQAKIPGYEGQTPDIVAEKRMGAGKEAIEVPGIDPDYLRLWRPVA